MKITAIPGRIFNRFRSLINVKRFSKTWIGKHLTMIQLMELDACMHCRTCSSQCSVAVAFEGIPNINILPSEKVASIRALASGKKLTREELRNIQEGVYLCTNCYRCTVACPAGIDLQKLWFDVREILLKQGYPEYLVLSPLSFYRGLMKEEIALRPGKRF